MIGNVFRNVSMDKKNPRTRRQSIPEYKTIRKILTQAELKPEIEFDDFETELKSINVAEKFMEFKKSLGRDYTPDYFAPTITVVSADNSIKYNAKFKSFLCEMETFKWYANEQAEDYETHRNRQNVAYNGVYPTYTIHLVKMLGNDIALFTMNTLDKTKTSKLKDNFYDKIDSLEPYFFESQNRIFNFPKTLNVAPDTIVSALAKNNLPNSSYYSPLFFREFKQSDIYARPSVSEKFLYTCHFSEEIRNKTKRYALVNCLYMYSHSGHHYTFLFIDHRDRIVEYYDPEVFSNRKTGILFTYKALQTIFPGYKINNFWRTSSIQKTEEYEKDEVGFCVKWGHMIMHLKLLNINMSVELIESSLIRECETKNLSLYELVLNYTYLMRRNIPADMNKMLKLKKLLMK
jgi:hypothetical protein